MFQIFVKVKFESVEDMSKLTVGQSLTGAIGGLLTRKMRSTMCLMILFLLGWLTLFVNGVPIFNSYFLISVINKMLAVTALLRE